MPSHYFNNLFGGSQGVLPGEFPNQLSGQGGQPKPLPMPPQQQMPEKLSDVTSLISALGFRPGANIRGQTVNTIGDLVNANVPGALRNRLSPLFRKFGGADLGRQIAQNNIDNPSDLPALSRFLAQNTRRRFDRLGEGNNMRQFIEGLMSSNPNFRPETWDKPTV